MRYDILGLITQKSKLIDYTVLLFQLRVDQPEDTNYLIGLKLFYFLCTYLNKTIQEFKKPFAPE
jgi:hypothetical protein